MLACMRRTCFINNFNFSDSLSSEEPDRLSVWQVVACARVPVPCWASDDALVHRHRKHFDALSMATPQVLWVGGSEEHNMVGDREAMPRARHREDMISPLDASVPTRGRHAKDALAPRTSVAALQRPLYIGPMQRKKTRRGLSGCCHGGLRCTPLVLF